MPFGPWSASGPAFDEAIWRSSVEAHERGMSRLGELGARVVAGSRARVLDGKRANEAFLWTSEAGVKGVHTKQFFPDEEGYFEARWFEPGDRHFRIVEAGDTGSRVGFLICTELMFNEHARRYGREGADIILAPRAVGRQSLPRWEVAARMAAIVSGAFVLSSNRGGVDANGQEFGGRGWVVDPEGDVLAQTSSRSSVVFVEIDLDQAARAKTAYPCYVSE
jgi:N-carbamoylputrescine amidase